MKKLLVFLILVAAGVWWWQYPELMRSYAAKAAHQTGMFFLNIFEKTPDPAIPKPELLPPEPPEDVYYTRERIEFGVHPENGMLAAGTAVRKVGEGNGKFVVESGNSRLVVDPLKLTRNPQEIASLQRKTDSSSDAALLSSVALLGSKMQEIDRRIADAKNELRIAESTEAAARAKGQGLSFGNNTVFLKNQISRLEATKKELTLQGFELLKQPLAEALKERLREQLDAGLPPASSSRPPAQPTAKP